MLYYGMGFFHHSRTTSVVVTKILVYILVASHDREFFLWSQIGQSMAQ